MASEDPRVRAVLSNFEIRETLADVGLGLQTWSLVEVALTMIFRTCFSPADQLRASVAFNAVQNITTRLDMLTNVLYSFNAPKYPDDEFLDIWEKLKSEVRNQSRKRARLAHFSVDYTEDKDGVKEFRVVPFLSAWPSRPKKTPFPISRDQILAMSHRWQELYFSLMWFLGELEERRGLPRGYQQPPNDLIDKILSQVSQTPKEPGHQLLPSRLLSQFGAWLARTFS